MVGMKSEYIRVSYQNSNINGEHFYRHERDIIMDANSDSLLLHQNDLQTSHL
jgi:hypothetical protein